MAIQIRAKTDPVSTNGTSVTVTKPTGTVAGDFMLLMTTVSNPAAGILQAPAGWTEIQRGGLNDDDPAVGWFKVAGASEPADYTLTINLTGAIGAGIISFYSDTAQPITIDDVQQQYNASGDRVYPSVTFSAAGYLICYGTTLLFNTTPAPGMTEQWDVTISSNRAYCMTEAIGAAGASGTRTATGTTAASNCISLALVEGATVYRCPQWRSYDSYGPTNSTTSFDVDIPADAEAGDLLLLQVVTDADRTITTPTGWTLLSAQAGAGGQHIYSRTAEAGDAGDAVTVAFDGATVAMIGIIAAIYSPNGKSLTISDTTAGTGTAAAGITYPSVTAEGVDALLVGIASNSATTGVEAAAHDGFFERIDLGSTACHTFWGTELLSVAGATAARALNYTTGTQDYFALSLAIEEVNEGILFNGTDLRPWLKSWSLESNMRVADTTVIPSTAAEQIPILSDWRFNMTGLWAAALDDVLGAQVAQSQDADNSLFVEIDGAVTYESDTVFVSGYKVEMNVDNALVWSGSIAISGAPERGTL
jgi:hypothetical protein